MAKTRALMTDTERERIAGLEEVEDIKVYQAKSRIRRRIEEELTFDVELLEEHAPELYQELVEAVCPDEPARREAVDTQARAGTEEPAAETVDASVSEATVDQDDEREQAEGTLVMILPGETDVKLEARVDAVLAMYDRLRERGGEPVHKDELLALVDAEEVYYGSVDSFWSNAVKKSGNSPNALTALPGVEQGPNQGEYRYVADA